MKYGSKEIIGEVEGRFEELKEKGLDWRSFYLGWIEGRANILKDKNERQSIHNEVD